MKEHIKRWKWLYSFYLLTVINYFVANSYLNFIVILGMILMLIMFYRATVDILYNGGK